MAGLASTLTTGPRRFGRLPWAIGVVGLLVVALLHGLPVRAGIEADLTGRAQAVLEQAGAEGVAVTFRGRDARLTGALPAGLTADQLAGQVAALTGVRVVEAELTAPAPEPAPVEPEPTAAPAPLPSRVVAVLADGVLTLTGVVPSRASADGLVAAAAVAVSRERVVDLLALDETLDTDGLVGLGALLGAVGSGGSVTASLVDRDLAVTGVVPDEVTRRAVRAAARAAGGEVAVDLRLPGEPPTATEVEGQLAALPRITFDPSSATLTAEGRAAVEQAATILAVSPDLDVRIEGHTDDLGDDAVNLALSADRAAVVEQTLVDLGIAPERLSSVGLGEAAPVVPNDSDVNRATNRRVEFVVS